MQTTIPDLWGDAITVDILTPIAILNAQSEFLKQKTQGIVWGELIGRQKGNVLTVWFDLRAPALNGFRTRILGVKHLIDQVYPASVTAANLYPTGGDSMPTGALQWDGAQGSRRSILTPTQEAFIEVVGRVLHSSDVTSTIQSLIARSNEARQPANLKVELLTEEPPSEESLIGEAPASFSAPTAG